jgi:transposase
LDESGFAVDMPRMHGYAQVGKRCYGSCNWHARGRINVIGASINMKLISIGLFDAHIDSDIFYQWTVECLLPELRQNSVIVLDNAAFHKRRDIQLAIIRAGHRLLYLPPYSPDLNEIEQKWAQAKSIRRKLQCNVDELFGNYVN